MRKMPCGWRAIRYSMYNPTSAKSSGTENSSAPLTETKVDFHGWPGSQPSLRRVLAVGQKYGRIDGDFTISGDTLTRRTGWWIPVLAV